MCMYLNSVACSDASQAGSLSSVMPAVCCGVSQKESGRGERCFRYVSVHLDIMAQNCSSPRVLCVCCAFVHRLKPVLPSAGNEFSLPVIIRHQCHNLCSGMACLQSPPTHWDLILTSPLWSRRRLGITLSTTLPTAPVPIF